MRMYDIIEKKKHGLALTRDEIFDLIEEYTAGNIPDYQMSAFLMAVYFRSMTDEEIFDLTEAMATSGDIINLSEFGDRSVDKHSTGGVGDKTTLIVAPIVAAAGGIVAKMSGRGLGHTGGTVDKLETFDGFRTSLSPEDFSAQVQKYGIAVIGQSANLAPADKKLYALRDVTATVDSIPLISSSIMSKKLAAGTRSIVLDVKCGSGAFMQTANDARALAEMMVKIGKAHGRNTAAVITNMDVPLGHAIGNALEIKEAVDVLCGKGPEDLRTVCLTLASLMIELSCSIPADKAREMAREILESGKAHAKFCEWIEAQGGDPAAAKDTSLLCTAKHVKKLCAESDGYMLSCNAAAIGTAACVLGAGRQTKDDVIDHSAGIILLKKPSDFIKKGDVIAELHTNRTGTVAEAEAILRSAFTFSCDKVEPQKLIYEIVN